MSETSFISSATRTDNVSVDYDKPEIPNAETIAAMKEGEQIALDPKAKSYTLDEALAEFKKW